MSLGTWDSVEISSPNSYSGYYWLRGLTPATRYEARVKEVSLQPTDYSDVYAFQTKGIASIKFSKYQIIFDDNHDQIVNPGEMIRLYIFLKNTSDVTARTVESYFGCSQSTQMQLLSYSGSAAGIYNDPNSNSTTEDSLTAWQESCGLNISHPDTFSFQVSNMAPPGTILTFYTDIWFYCDSFYHSLDSFTVTVH